MKNSQNPANGRLFRTVTTGAFTSAALRYKANVEFCNLQAQLGGLAGSGEEVQVLKAILRIQIRSTLYGSGQLAFIVSDAAIAAADPGENTLVGNFDDDVDVMTAGDYETKVLQSFSLKENPASGVYTVNITKDVTPEVQKAAQLLAKSAILSTNPYMSFIGTMINITANTTPGFNSTLEIVYRLGPKKLRMLA